MNEELEIKKIRFTSRPESVPYFYRLSYRASITCLLLKLTCRKNSSCSLTKLHLIITLMFNEDESNKLIEYINKNDLSRITLRFDPTVNTTVEYLLAEKLIYLNNSNQFMLTDKGNSFVDAIISDSGLLIKEKAFFKKIGSKLSEVKIKQISNQLI
ncbi:hypothetical protein [Lysinibacillus sphaericus]|uniref:hypothetical protein n=1 Tax=Lysinibacillus sphaericus TaxID=1421 RepID=UPI003D72097D